jgi:lipopolysaccharide/colanic/teichoic acid biosynthesis glycosyltransferase
MIKRLFDILLSFFGLLTIGWLVFLFWILTSIQYRSNGLFLQKRVGQFGSLFRIFKLRTIHPLTYKTSTLSEFLRKSKIDELPQLLNILLGQMSFVGPRPDIPGYYDKLEGENRKILELKPGLTSEASIKYANEEEILSQKDNPLDYNDTVIFPDKVKMNLEYFYNQSILVDLQILIRTVFR